jgi:Tol biopolymer transport system component
MEKTLTPTHFHMKRDISHGFAAALIVLFVVSSTYAIPELLLGPSYKYTGADANGIIFAKNRHQPSENFTETIGQANTFGSTTTAPAIGPLKADYQFQGNLNSSVGNAPPLTDLVAAGNGANGFRTDTVDGYSRQVLDFPANNGVNIPDLSSIVADTTKLTIVMLFQFTDSQMQSKKLRLFDYSACTSQTGGRYLLNGKIEGEAGNHAASRQFNYFQVVVTRSGVGGTVTIYRDGQVATTETDDGTALTSGLRFFHDCAWGLATTGSIARIRVYDGVMTAQEVHTLDRVPESTTGTLPALFYSNRSGVNEIYRMNTDGGSQIRITNNDAKPELYGKFSPDGQKIVYQRRETGADPWQIWTSNADGSNPVRLTNTSTIDKAPSWRPDGQKILFSRCNGAVCDLFTMNPDGSGQAAVSPTATDEDLAVFTPDGTKLVFSCSDANFTNYQICISNADGSNRLALTNTVAPVVNVDARVSADGSKIVYGSAGPTPLIKTMNLDGSNVVTWPSVNNPQLPVWSPDGTKIMYSRSVGAFLEVFVANADGTSPVQITNNSADDIATDWYRPQLTPTIGLVSSNLGFGSQVVGTTSSAQNVTVQNTGTANLTLGTISLSGTDAAQFSAGAPSGTTIAPAGSATIPVQFSPTSTGAKSASLDIASNDAANPVVHVSLSGTGTPPPTPTPTPTPVPTPTPGIGPLKADYQFQGTLDSSVGTAPTLTNLVGTGNGPNAFVTDTVDGFSRQVLNFPLNNGVAINSLAGVVNDSSFTMVMTFKLGALSGRRRLLDASGGTAADQGAFLVDGRIEGESLSTNPLTANTYFQLVLVRGGGFLKVYRDGFLVVTDTDDGSPLSNGLRFFQDYVNNPVQASGGSIARLRFYEGMATDDEVAALDRVPETVSGKMPLLTVSNRFGRPNRFRMNIDGTSQHRLTSGSVLEGPGKFSPDGTKIVYQGQPGRTGTQKIYISNADGSNPIQLTDSASNDAVPSWRPDGQKIIFSRCSAGTCDIYTMNPDGSDLAPLAAANTANSEDFPRYTPDGTKIVFLCSLAGNSGQLCTANADGTNRVQITNIAAPVQHTNIDISPDGTKIMCIRGSNAGDNRITIMNLDGTGTTQLSQLTNSVATPVWSPDGTKIAYSRISIGNTREIHIANADGSGETRLTFNSADDIVSDWFRGTVRRTQFDFDGDGKADQGVYRPEEGIWYLLQSRDGVKGIRFGLAGDKPVAGDYDGDGKTDAAIYRNGVWWILYSNGSGYRAIQWGISSDIPVPADYDGDGKTDIAVYRDGTWWILFGSGYTAIQWGIAGDVPVPADYDGDGKADLAVYRAGVWWILKSNQSGYRAVNWGLPTDTPVPADYDGDAKADLMIFRNGQWWIQYGNGSGGPTIQWGITGDKPVPADYDGDGKTDLAIYRNGQWWTLFSGGYSANRWGISTDLPVSAR